MSDPSAQASPEAAWWPRFFDDAYAAYGLASREPAFIEQTVHFLQSTLELSAGQTVFDQCCGIGRLSIPLARGGGAGGGGGDSGLRVIGVDQSASYIAEAQREADRQRLPCRFFTGDAFEFVAPEPCDAAINWFTSFGYCEDDAVNGRMLQRAFESLKTGGRFALEYMNLPRVFAEFRQWYIDRPTNPALNGLVVMHETRPDFDTGMLESDWTFLQADGRRDVRRVSTRMLLPNDIARMFRRHGFEDIRLFGAVNGEPLTRMSKRCIVVGRKP